MATEVEIFKIDFADSIVNIKTLKNELKETRKAFELAKPNTEEFAKYATGIKTLDTNIKQLNGATKENTNALGGVNSAVKFAAGSYGELKQKIDTSKKALLELNVESEEFANEQKNLISLQEQRIAIEKKIPSLFQERIKGALNEAESLQKLKAELVEVNKAALNGDGKAAERAKELKDSIYTLSMAVGAQSNSLKQLKVELREAQSAALNGDGKAAARVAELKEKMEDLREETKSLQGSGIERLNTSVNLLSQGFQDFDFGKVKTGFKGIGAAMSAIPIILIIEGIKALIDNFDEVVKFAKELTGGFTGAAKAVRELTVATEADTIVNKNLIASYDNEIALLTAKGASEKEITEVKKKKIKVEIAEAENSLRLASAKAAEILLNDSITESIDRIIVAGLRKIGADQAADALEKVILQNKKERGKEEFAAVQDANIKIAASKTALQVLDIELGKKQTERAKENSKKRIELQQTEQARLADIINAAIDKEEELRKKIYQEETDAFFQKELDIEKSDTEFNEKKYQRDIDRAKSEVLIAENNGSLLLEAKQHLLDAELAKDLANTELTEEAKQEIRLRYREQNRQLVLQAAGQELQTAQGLVTSLGQLSDAYFDLKRQNLQKGSEEDKRAAEQQFKVNKAFSIASTLISGAQSVISASASVPYLYVGLAASIAASVATTAAVAKIASTKFQYFEGGYTGPGNPTDESYSIGNKQFHKDEYVVPSRVLNTPKGSLLAAHLEGIRKGTTNPMPHISGFFDGGFTGRSISRQSESAVAAQNNIADIIANIPTPVVRVTDINNVSNSNQKAINVSSL